MFEHDARAIISQFYLDAALEYISDKFLVFFNFDINNHYAKTYS